MGWICFSCKEEKGTFATDYESKNLVNENVNPPSGFGENDKICQNCFNKLKKEQMKEHPGEVGPTRFLYLAPIFMGILGGILMYIAVKEDNREMANTGMIVGVIFTIIGIIFYAIILFAGFASIGDIVPI